MEGQCPPHVQSGSPCGVGSPPHAETLAPTLRPAGRSSSRQLLLEVVRGGVSGLTAFSFFLSLQPEHLQKNWLREFYQVRGAAAEAPPDRLPVQ